MLLGQKVSFKWKFFERTKCEEEEAHGRKVRIQLRNQGLSLSFNNFSIISSHTRRRNVFLAYISLE